MSLTDCTIIHRTGAFEVLSQRFEVMWPDGSTVGLHPVRQAGSDCLYYRALPFDSCLWAIIDLRVFVDRLPDEVLAGRPLHGRVFKDLRAKFSDAQAFQLLASTRALQRDNFVQAEAA